MKIKKVFALVLSAAMAVGLLTSCGNNSSSNTDSAKEELNIYGWSEYIPADVIKDFEDKYGIKVNLQEFTSMEEGYSKMQSGAGDQFDLIQCNNTFAPNLIKQGLVQELDYSNIPNYKNIDDSAKISAYDPDHKYTVPYMGGYSMVIYNKKTCPIKITSFKDLANPALKDQIVSVTASRTVLGMALRALNYDVNTKEESEIAQATDLLKTIKPNIKVFDGDSPKTSLLNGECSVGIVYGGEAAEVLKEKPDDFEVAEIESTILGKNDWFIPKGAKNKKAAELFINYVSDGKVMAQILSEYPYSNFNTAANEYLSDDYKKNKALNLSKHNTDVAVMTGDVGDASVIYDKYWNEFMSN